MLNNSVFRPIMAQPHASHPVQFRSYQWTAVYIYHLRQAIFGIHKNLDFLKMLGKSDPTKSSPLKKKSTPKKTKSKKNHPSTRMPQTNQHLHASRFEDLPGVKVTPVILWKVLGGMKKQHDTHCLMCPKKPLHQQVVPQFWYLNRLTTRALGLAGLFLRRFLSETWRTKEVIHNAFERDHF